MDNCNLHLIRSSMLLVMMLKKLDFGQKKMALLEN
ncbi:hypothetical protein H5410_004098 [Solanum commersonii]|uniref:Uncharacterized protein n=1 Tax=Solanum commersonii TaxID=4109 RepID=A0A9J6B6F5_SOLCO|nr:hypothetical protein H5410_004098 [Solanum commersonii]